MDGLDYVTLGGFAATVVSIALSMWLVRAELQEQVVLEYTGRYQRILGDLPYAALESDFDVGILKSSAEWESTLKVIHQYFDLCSEEIKLERRHRVPSEVWRDWEEGIVAAMKGSLCHAAWREARFTGGYTTLRDFLITRGVHVDALG